MFRRIRRFSDLEPESDNEGRLTGVVDDDKERDLKSHRRGGVRRYVNGEERER